MKTPTPPATKPFLPAQKKRLGFAILLLTIAVLVQIMQAVSGDKVWLLALSHSWVTGKSLYHDLFEPNLPLITWLYALPVYFSSFTGLSDHLLLGLQSTAFAALSLALCSLLMRSHPMFTGERYRQWQHALLLGFVFFVWINPAFFGDRDDLALEWIFPYCLRWMPSLARQPFSRRLRISLALFAAVGLCIKPHILIFYLAIQLLYILRERSLRIFVSAENLIIYASLVVYLLLVDRYTTQYFSVLVPMLLATYSETNQGVIKIISYCTSAFMLAITLIEFRLRYQSPYRRDIYYLLGMCAAGLGYALANNGWFYTFYPMQAMILLVTGWVYLEFQWLQQEAETRGEASRSFLFGKRACMLNLAGNTLLVFAVYSILLAPQDVQDRLAPKSRIDTQLIALMRQEHIQRFGMMSASLSFWPEAIEQTGATMETRFNHLWMLAKFFTSPPEFTQRHGDIPAYVAGAYAEDLNNNKPQMMLVDASDEFYTTGKKIDLVAYFSVYPDFAQAWSHYQLTQVINYCADPSAKDRLHKGLCRYDIYERKPGE